MGFHHCLESTIFFSFLAICISGFPSFPPNNTSIPPAALPNIPAGAWQFFEKLAGCHTGAKVDGLAKLKQYLHQFGYIPNSLSNFTDNFDDTLESALKQYQLNFNLNTTGTLDESTVKQIVRPRCGVADIINGSSTMNSGKSSSSNPNFHTIAHYTFFPSRPKWPSSRQDLTYAFLTENQLSESVKTVFSRAFNRWATVTPLTFTETESFFFADIKIGFFSGDHGDGEPFDGVLGTLAHAFSPTSGRFHLDLDENWVTDGDISTATSPTAIDLESVAVHEIGHLLGLGHSSVEEAIMFPTISSKTKKVELAKDDIEGIQVLYGSNPNNNGSSSSTKSPPSTTDPSSEKESNGGGAFSVGPGLRFIFLTVVSLLLL